ncbi:hypothetical protein CALVIDRAFT_563376 [Calocera viscosa TUFC12733]|uniref:Uncharacterized protein n=1 Tax=Calocera viscosa (strain TUFC12733) TaxID=1330018 RepID=A0A167MYL1_CALVF|nr:hypothetical protein CALVIDRAFT_563376 [Calocera viscosa TUFC12733]
MPVATTNIDDFESSSVTSSYAPWLFLLREADKTYGSTLLSLGDEINACGRWLSPTDGEHERRLYFIECLSRKLTYIYPWSELVTFGSLLTRLYLPDGEIDAAVIWLYGRSVQGQHHPYDPTSTLLADIWPAFKWHYFSGDVGHVPERTSRAYAKLTHSDREFERQIRKSTDSGRKVATWINAQISAKPYLRHFILVVKAWASRNDLYSIWRGGINSYCLIVMIISFFQLRGRIGERASDVHRHLGKRLVSFFGYYGSANSDARSFDYDLGISVRSGGELFLPAARGWEVPDAKGLYVEDPCNMDNNLGFAVLDVDKIRTAFHAAYEQLLQAVYERKSGIDQGSILNTILGYDEEASIGLAVQNIVILKSSLDSTWSVELP